MTLDPANGVFGKRRDAGDGSAADVGVQRIYDEAHFLVSESLER
jgi:hypothetical protein